MPRRKSKLSDLVPDDKNFNTGTPYGNSLIEKSFKKFGAGRSILLDKNNKIIAGNKSVENAAAMGIKDLQIIESDGRRMIAVKRTDIDLDTPEGREMALADNQTSVKNIILDAELIEAELSEAVCEEWGISGIKEDPGISVSKKENLEPFQKTHVLISFHPQIMLKIQNLLQQIIDVEGVEYEQSSN